MKQCRTVKSGKNAGETLVEVVASIFIFLILMAVMQGAISYCTAALAKNNEIRQNTRAILEGLQGGTKETKATDTIHFYAVGGNGQTVGNTNVFDVQTDFQENTVSYTDGNGSLQQYRISLYGTPASTDTFGGGGDSP